MLAIDRAANRLGSAEDLLAHTAEVPRAAPGAHHARNADDVIHGNVASVLDVLLLQYDHHIPYGLRARIDRLKFCMATHLSLPTIMALFSRTSMHGSTEPKSSFPSCDPYPCPVSTYLLPVARGLLEGPDDHGPSSGHN